MLHLLFRHRFLLPRLQKMSSNNKSVLRHVVLFKFTAETTAEDLKKLEQEFHKLATEKIHQVKEFEWGTNVSKENLNHGFTHCYLLTFHSNEDRDIYLEHADHQAFVALLKPHLAGATVLDYWSQNSA